MKIGPLEGTTLSCVTAQNSADVIVAFCNFANAP